MSLSAKTPLSQWEICSFEARSDSFPYLKSGGRKFGMEFSIGNSWLHFRQVSFPFKTISLSSSSMVKVKDCLQAGHSIISTKLFFK